MAKDVAKDPGICVSVGRGERNPYNPQEARVGTGSRGVRLEWIIFRHGATITSQGPSAAGCDTERAHTTRKGTVREPGDADLGPARLVQERIGPGSARHTRARDIA